MGRAGLSVVALAIAVVAISAGPAHAGTPIQIGDLASGNPSGCGVGNRVQAAVAAGAPSYTVPSDGAITGWSHRGKDTDPGFGRLQVWRAAGATNYTLVGRSEIQEFFAGMNEFTTNISVSAGDLIGIRSSAGTVGCIIFEGAVGNEIRSDGFGASDATTGETRNMAGTTNGFRLNVSATLNPTDPVPPPGPVTLDSSATKRKQPAKKLKIKVTADQDSTLDVGGKGKVAQRAPASISKSKKFKLKSKAGIALAAGVQTTVRVKFKKNNKTLKRIKKLQTRSKKARKRSNVIGNLTATTAAGLVTTSKVKIKLKP